MLNKLNLDKHSPIPLHQQLYRFIKEAILSGVLKNGEKLLSLSLSCPLWIAALMES